jgi:DNA-binding response OmpR family regulator
MTKPPNMQPSSTDTAVVLSISPVESDHDALQEILNGSELKAQSVLHTASTLKSALPMLRTNQVGVVVSEQELGADTWKDVLAELNDSPCPPLLIVSSRIANDYLWAEALNLGAHDVLAKPFEREEVVRVCASAWRRWKDGSELPPNQQRAAEMVA